MSVTINNIDLVALIEREATIRLTQSSNTDGGEFWGACPFCRAGTDRFHVWPHSYKKKPHYWCRQCGLEGDAISFMREYHGISYREACELLDIDPDEKYIKPDAMYSYQFGDPPPNHIWQKTGMTLIEMCQHYLWN